MGSGDLGGLGAYEIFGVFGAQARPVLPPSVLALPPSVVALPPTVLALPPSVDILPARVWAVREGGWGGGYPAVCADTAAAPCRSLHQHPPLCSLLFCPPHRAPFPHHQEDLQQLRDYCLHRGKKQAFKARPLSLLRDLAAPSASYITNFQHDMKVIFTHGRFDDGLKENFLAWLASFAMAAADTGVDQVGPGAVGGGLRAGGCCRGGRPGGAGGEGWGGLRAGGC